MTANVAIGKRYSCSNTIGQTSVSHRCAAWTCKMLLKPQKSNSL